MILIIGAWIYYFLISLSIGAGLIKLIARYTGNPLHFGLFYQFWFGFAVVIGLLQGLSLFLPISNIAFILLSLLALISAVFNAKTIATGFNGLFKKLFTLPGLLAFLAVFVMLLMVSYGANKEVLHGDTFLYHWNGVRWAREYPAVPGLANLHHRLGFNSSFFLFAALTETGFASGESTHIALSFLFVTCLIHWFFIIIDPRELMQKRIFCMFTSIFLLLHIFQQIDITSLSTDYPMAILTLVFCVIMLDKLDNKVLLLLPLSAAIFALKLSGMLTVAFGLVILAGYIFYSKYSSMDKAQKKPLKRLNIISFVLLGFIVAGFIIRNVIVSGWLVFPFPVGNLHLPWSVPKPYTIDAMEWVKSYARVPGGASPTTIKEHDFFWWFTRWFANFKRLFEFDMLVGAGVVLLGAAFQITSLKKFILARLNLFFVILFSIASIAFWFISAPEIRFGTVYFFILFASTAVFFYEATRYKSILKLFIFIVFIHQLVYRLPSYNIDRGPRLFTFAYTQPRALVRKVGSPAGEKPELYIYMPAQYDGCGNSPLPCTPYANGMVHIHNWLKQRVPGDLSKGFLAGE